MTETPVPLSPEVWVTVPSEAQALIVALQAEVRELRARLGQDSSNSSRPPSSDPPQAPAKAERQKPPTGRKRGGQPGHRGSFRVLLPSEGVAITNLEQAQSAALGPVYTEARTAVRTADVANLDETGWREDKHRAWLWTVVTAALTVFHIDRSRGGAVVETLLGPKFAGVVGSDRWSAYNRFLAKQRALCYAHLK
jgi:hypothetical protein